MPAPNAALRRTRFVAIACAAVIGAAVVASCAGVRPASRPPPAASGDIISAPASARPATAPATTGPAPPAAATAPLPATPPVPMGTPSPAAPAATTPSAAAAMPAEPNAPPASAGAGNVAPSTPPSGIALILPLENKAFARAAEAVRAGFIAAATSAGEQDTCIVIGHGEDGVLPAFEDARARNVKVIVGPLLRDDVKAVAQLALDLPFTVALNQLDEGAPVPPNFYTFSLGVESDARLIAKRLHGEAVPQVAIVSTETPLMKRFAGAFATDWVQMGGPVPDVYHFDATPETLTALRRGLGRKNAPAVLLAMDSANATLAKPYLGTAAAYASGLVFERVDQAGTRDLDDLVVVEIPWIVTPDADQFANLPRQEFGSAALTRLYAFGLDAFRVAQAFRDGMPERFALDGATGQVTLVEGHQFAREGRFAVFRAGQLTPLDVPH